MWKQKLNKKFVVIFFAIFVFALAATIGYSTLVHKKISYQAETSEAAATCTIDAKLVNSCRPWLSAAAGGYSMAGSNSITNQINFFEKRLNNPNVLTNPSAATTVTKKLDIVHTYHTPGKNVLTAEEIAFVNRPNTILQTNWKPAESWATAGGGNASVNATIDQMANSIKSVSPKKIMLAVYHEPEDNVSVGSAGAGCTTKGSNGSPADYVNMWHNVRARFDAAGVTNVVWNMNYMGFSNWNCLVSQIWPGNSYVDWVTWDPYSNGVQTFDSSVKNLYDYLTLNSNAAHDYMSKPWGLSEFGYWNNVGNSTEAQAPIYWQQAKTSITTNKWPKIKLYSVFDTNQAVGGVYTSSSLVGLQFNTTILPSIPEQTAFNAFADAIFALGGTTTPPPTGDTTKPTVSFTAPASGASVANVITITLSASDNVGITKVDIYVDDTKIIKNDTNAADGWQSQWDTKSVGNGSHTFKAVATDAAGNSSTATRQVTINNVVAAPTISSFSANPTVLTVGNAAVLTWSSANSASCSINPNGPQDSTSSTWTTPKLTTPGIQTYSLVCKNSANTTVSKTVTVTVNPAPTPPSNVKLSSSVTTLQNGGSVSLSWTSNGSVSCTLNPGNYSASGAASSKTITGLTATTTYKATCSNNAGSTDSNQLTVTVTQAPPPPADPTISSLTATPSNVANGASSVIAWQASNVISGGCALAPSPLSSTSATGQWTTPLLIASNSYTLTCKNSANKTVSKSISVTVANAPAPPPPAPKPPEVIVPPTPTPESPNVPATTGEEVVATEASGSVTQGQLATLDASNVTNAQKVDQILKVEFYNGQDLVYTVTQAPFAIDTANLPVGNLTITQRTYFKDGSVAEESQIIEVKGASVAGVESSRVTSGIPIKLFTGAAIGLLLVTAGLVIMWYFILRPKGYSLMDVFRQAGQNVKSKFPTHKAVAPTNVSPQIDEPIIIRPDKKDDI